MQILRFFPHLCFMFMKETAKSVQKKTPVFTDVFSKNLIRNLFAVRTAAEATR
jgi:hypothetical protein